jgi:hypothetical protein
MSATAALDLSLDVGADAVALVTLSGLGGLLIACAGATAQLGVRATDLDPSPLFTISTTGGALGQLTFGVAQPSGGLAASSANALAQAAYPFTPSTAAPTPVTYTPSTIAAMAALSTTGVAAGTIAFVQAALGSWFAWSPGDTNTPNGATIVTSTSGTVAGNWLLMGTVTISITAAATLLLSGYNQAFYDLVVTWGNGTKTKLLSGNVWIAQTETH